MILGFLLGTAQSQIIPRANWPKGSYGLTKSDSGCPTGYDSWKEGIRYHDTEPLFPSNDWSIPLNFYGYYGKNDMEQHFCMKIIDDGVEETEGEDWPEGAYCIFKAQDRNCPPGFEEPGYIIIDDHGKNNQVWGDVPDGVYTEDTLLRYCCRDDGFTSNPIKLPKDTNFFLFRHADVCQQVDGMNVMDQWFYWDCTDWFPNNEAGFLWTIPTCEVGRNVKIHYCYYWKIV